MTWTSIEISVKNMGTGLMKQICIATKVMFGVSMESY
jgi:hypothetical protein